MAQQNAFGHIRTISGKAGSFDATLVPLGILNALRTHAIPITLSGSSNVTFTISASTTKPVYIWSGRDIIALRSNLSYTFTNDSTNVIVATTGAKSTAQTPGAVGVRYFYAGIDSAGAIEMFPSTNAPSFVEGPFPAGELGHPGVARDRVWNYVGWAYLNATTPAFDAAQKIGYVYNMSDHAYAGVDTQPGYITMAALPAHAGVEAGGFVTGVVTMQAVALGGATDATLTNAVIGAWQTYVGGTSVAAAGVAHAAFDGIPLNSSGNMLAHIASVATTVNVRVTKVRDIV